MRGVQGAVVAVIAIMVVGSEGRTAVRATYAQASSRGGARGANALPSRWTKGSLNTAAAPKKVDKKADKKANKKADKDSMWEQVVQAWSRGFEDLPTRWMLLA